jgi:transposase InsO family protein
LSTISGRAEYTDPGEKFENITMLLFEPMSETLSTTPSIRLIDTVSNRDMTEDQYFDAIRQIYNRRNPHAAIGEDIIEMESDE